MSVKTKVPYKEAEAIAQEIRAKLEPACERIVIAGSVRRGRREIGDIELVAIPSIIVEKDLFGETIYNRSLLDSFVLDLAPGDLSKDGPRYKQFTYQGMTIDLFITTPERWGVILAIRTGPASFSKKLVTKRSFGGFCPNDLRFEDGRIWRGSEPLETPEERDVFDALGIEWTGPAFRDFPEYWPEVAR